MSHYTGHELLEEVPRFKYATVGDLLKATKPFGADDSKVNKGLHTRIYWCLKNAGLLNTSLHDITESMCCRNLRRLGNFGNKSEKYLLQLVEGAKR